MLVATANRMLRFRTATPDRGSGGNAMYTSCTLCTDTQQLDSVRGGAESKSGMVHTDTTHASGSIVGLLCAVARWYGCVRACMRVWHIVHVARTQTEMDMGRMFLVR